MEQPSHQKKQALNVEVRAALDLGTNSFLCLIAEVEGGQITKVLEDHCALVRMGQGLGEAGGEATDTFHPEALERAKKCLEHFSQRIKKHGVKKTLAVSTSAARRVKDPSPLLELGRRLGIFIEVISGVREAELTYMGAMKDQKKEGTVLLDIGGGSTEFITKKVTEETTEEATGILAKSVNVGAVVLTQGLDMKASNKVEASDKLEASSKVDIANPTEFEKIEKIISQVQKKICDELTNFSDKNEIHKVVAVAGTPTALAQLEINEKEQASKSGAFKPGVYDPSKIEHSVLSKKRIVYWLKTLCVLSTAQRVERFFLPEKRADVLVAGCILLLATLDFYNLDEITVSAKGLRYGLICQSDEVQEK